MVRRLDREIQAWSQRPKRAQLSLLWDDVERDEVKVISYWEEAEWSSTYIISASQPRRPLPGKWWALCFIEPEGPGPAEILRSDDSEGRVRTLVAVTDAKEIRRLLEVPGVEERVELCDLLISLGGRRDEMDIPALLGFSNHRDRVVRYTALGLLSWQPAVSNDLLGHRFGEDPDWRVADLARRFASGTTPRKTRPDR